MAGPWDKYQAPTETGPWANYGSERVPLTEVQKAGIDKDMKRMADPTGSFAENSLAGTGKAFADIGRGVSQLVGFGPNKEETQEIRRRDAPLMKTGGGIAGNISGNVALFAPLAMVPGANAVAGAGAIGVTMGALSPAEDVQERLLNMGKGGALGSLSQYAGTSLAAKMGERQAANQMLKSQNSVRDETLRMGREAGMVVPPSAVNPNVVNRILESLGGKAATGQQAVATNAPAVDALARRYGGLQPGEALSVPSLQSARQRMAQPYRDIAGISPQAATALEALKQARHESKLQWKGYNRSGNPEMYKAAGAADAQVGQQQQAIEQAATGVGRQDLLPALKEAQRSIAQNRLTQESLNRGSGRADPAVFGRALDRGAPLTGDGLTIARMQQAFPQYMKDMSGQQAPGTNQLLGLLASALSGGAGHMAGGVPGAMAGFAAPFVIPQAARSAVLSGPGQKLLASPSKGQSPLDPALAAFLARALVPPAALAEQ